MKRFVLFISLIINFLTLFSQNIYVDDEHNDTIAVEQTEKAFIFLHSNSIAEYAYRDTENLNHMYNGNQENIKKIDDYGYGYNVVDYLRDKDNKVIVVNHIWLSKSKNKWEYDTEYIILRYVNQSNGIQEKKIFKKI